MGEVIKTWNEYKRRYYPDCICTIDQVKNNMHHQDCEWCNEGFECNPNLSDPEVEYEEDRL